MNIIDHVQMLKGIDQAVTLAGFLLANSADNLSYIDEVKVLTPFSICFKKNQFHPKFHTGKSQAEAVTEATKELIENKSKCDAWAFAREGVSKENGQPSYAILVYAWSKGMHNPVLIIQSFVRVPIFRLDGAPIVGVDGVAVSAEESKPILNFLQKGIYLHEDGGSKWDTWH